MHQPVSSLPPVVSALTDHDAILSFLADVTRNLRVVRRLYGHHSVRYHGAVSMYSDVATTLGCRPELERVLQGQRRCRVRPRVSADAVQSRMV